MTDAQYLNWLKDPSAIRTVLIEAAVQIAGVETTIYMSTAAYNTAPTDAPANVHYRPIASVGVLFTEQLSLTGDGALSAGDLEIANYGGEYDDWLTWIWTNRPLKAYIGDVRWARADFRPIFDGVIADIGTSGREKLLLRLRDKLQRLNGAITETKLGGTTQNSDALVPVAFGEVHNVTPLLVDPANLRYQIHGGPVASIFEVRDNGVPVSAIVDNATATFTLEYSPAGAVTVSAKGDNPGGVYGSTVAQLVQRLVTGYGKATDRFTLADIDAANFAAFDAAHPQPVGYYATDRTNVLVACQDLAGSLGAQLSMTRMGQLRLVQITLPAAAPVLTVRPSQMVERSLAPIQRTDPVAAVKLGFNKNWTVQQGLVTAIPEEHKDLFATEWLTSTKLDAGTQASYRLNGEPDQLDTMLLRRVDADAEAQRRVDLWKVPRMAYEFEGQPELLTLELGQVITVVHPRFGMAAGVNALVISLAPDWGTCRVKVGFIVLPAAAGGPATVPPVAAIANDRDALLHGADQRDIDMGLSKALLLSANATAFHVDTANNGSPASITITALPIGIPGAVSFATAPAVTLTGTGNLRNLAYADMSADVVTVTATMNYAGVAYERTLVLQKVRDGANGAAGANGTNGARGSGTYYATGSAWSDATADAACPGGKVVGDAVVISNGGTYAMTKVWTGAAWQAPGAVLDGNLLVSGSVKAAAINTNGLTIRDTNGNVIFSSSVKLDYKTLIANTPAALSDINSAQGSKLNGIEAGATNGASFGVNIGGKITAANASTFIDSAAIGNAMIGNLVAEKITSGTLYSIALKCNPNSKSFGGYSLTIGSNGILWCDSVVSSMLYAGNSSGPSYPAISASTVTPGVAAIQSSGDIIPSVTNSYNCGNYGYAWAGVYAQSGAITTSDRREKTEVLDSDLGLDFVMRLRPVSYRMIEGRNTEIDHGEMPGPFAEGVPQIQKYIEVVTTPGVRRHYGLIAQEVKAALGDKDAAFWILGDKDDPDSGQALRYEELIPVLMKALQQLNEKVDAIEPRAL